MLLIYFMVRLAYMYQESLPVGSTIIPVILGSDSTHLTNFSGGKKAWPVYMSLGNIPSNVRNNQSSRAWMVLAYIPVVDFIDDSKIRTTLLSRVYHQCMEICLDSLVEPGMNGTLVANPYGWLRLCYPRLAANICDYPEQCLTGCAAALTSPVTTARFHQLDSCTLSPPRTREWILTQIQHACEEADPEDIPKYLAAARKRGLNGVHLPYWRFLPGYRPEIAICPDIMHGVVKFWRDHILTWSLALIGEGEYDKRLRALQPTIGFKHFKAGIRHLSQWTCREDKELMRTHVALLAGAPGITSKVMENLRAFHDFAYLVQYSSHSVNTIKYISDALKTFHATKDEYIRLGVRKGKEPHMRIPKLYGHLVYPTHIPEMGTSSQYSTEIVESNHRTMAKQPYKATNRKNFAVQMCRKLDRDDRIAHLKELIWWSEQQRMMNALDSAFGLYTPGYRERAMENYNDLQIGPKETRKLQSHYLSSRLWLADRPHMEGVEVHSVSTLYQLPDLHLYIQRFLRSLLDLQQVDPAVRINRDFQIVCMDVWKKLTIRTPNVQDDDEVSIIHSVEAVPPSASLPYGRCHCVLVHCDSEAQSIGIQGTQSSLYHS
jgi:hypothetical protein